MSEHVSIGELAKETGVKVVTIRYYEQVGVLPPPERTEGNYRTYSREHAKRLRFIRRCRDLGFSLDEIRDLLRLSSEDAQSCVDVCVIAERHLEAVEEKIADLSRLALELRSISASCNGNRPMAECRIIEALSFNATSKTQEPPPEKRVERPSCAGRQQDAADRDPRRRAKL